MHYYPHDRVTACDCNVLGSIRDDCEQMTGKCVCKPGIVGLKCTICPNGNDLGLLGCTGKKFCVWISVIDFNKNRKISTNLFFITC